MDLQVLRTEIDTDPKSLGYEGKTSQEITDLLNTVGLSAETVDAGVIDAYEVVNALEGTDVAALTTLQLQRLSLVVSAGLVDISAAKIQSFLAGLFGAGTDTRTNLIALGQKSASRAEVLGLPIVKKEFVERAQLL